MLDIATRTIDSSGANGAVAPEPCARPARAAAEDAVRTLIRWAGDDPAREGLRATPARVVRAYEEWFEGYRSDPAAQLKLRAETVKTRLHRARRLLRTALVGTLAATLNDAFPFLGQRCQRMTETVLQRVLAVDPKT
jgi:hypothetical protein